MFYELKDLLDKMGAPEAAEKGSVKWYCFDEESGEVAGFAEVKLIEDGKRLIAEQKHIRRNYTDDDGNFYEAFIEEFYLHAKRDREGFIVTKIAFDKGNIQNPPSDAVELGLGMFRASAVNISILMEQQRDTIIQKDIIENLQQSFGVAVSKQPEKLSPKEWGVVVPFARKTATS